MSAPPPQPSDSVQRAANLYARELARGVALREIPGRHPEAFEALSPAERGQARRYGVGAYTVTQALREAPQDTPLSALPEFVTSGIPAGVFDVTVGFGTPDPVSGQHGAYRTVIVAADSATSLASAGAAALDALGYEVDGEDPDTEDLELRYLPFDLAVD